MTNDTLFKVAILYPGDAEQRKTATPGTSRFLPVFRALADLGVQVEPAVYHDDVADDVRAQLIRMDGVLVWVNPIEGGRDRTQLDAMLRQVAASGVYVSTHPDVILKLGTKEVLYQTRDVGWGSDVELYVNATEFSRRFPDRLLVRRRMVVKQARGNDGQGVWRVDLLEQVDELKDDTSVVVWDASTKNSDSVVMTFKTFMDKCAEAFSCSGVLIDQEFQSRLADGMIRCYFTHDEVVGFCRQWPKGLLEVQNQEDRSLVQSSEMVGPETAAYQRLRRLVSDQWLPEAMLKLKLGRDDLPAIWDADFLLGERNEEGHDTYVLCEINVSAVWPFPPMAAGRIVQAAVSASVAARNIRRQR